MPVYRVRVVEAVVFIVLVYAATIALPIYQPPTGGYFNLGESMIYLAALVSSPLVAGIAGGVGASLADLTTGYAIFAPGTLVIKFIEGFVAGLLVKRMKRIHGIIGATLTGVVYFILVLVVYSTLGGITLGPSEIIIPGTSISFVFNPPYIEVGVAVWIAIGALVGGVVLFALLRKHIYAGEIFALAIAGSLMVLGYFLYEYFYSNPATGRAPIAAILEVPVNIGQVIVGVSIALPIVTWLRRAGYIS